MVDGSNLDVVLSEFVTSGDGKLAIDSSIPLYYQLYLALQRFIQQMGLDGGDRFPSEASIAASFKVSRPTVNKAVQELVNQGWLIRRRGRGAFVQRKPLVQLALLSDSLSFIDQFSGDIPHRTKVIRKAVIPCIPQVAQILELPTEEPIFYIRRLHFVYDRPIMVCDAKLPSRLFPGLEEGAFVDNSLYATLERRYDTPISRSERCVEASYVREKEVAELLNAPMLSPILLLTGLTFTRAQKPIEYITAYVKEGVAFKNIVHQHSGNQQAADRCPKEYLKNNAGRVAGDTVC